jgi:hypothetical protein
MGWNVNDEFGKLRKEDAVAGLRQALLFRLLIVRDKDPMKKASQQSQSQGLDSNPGLLECEADS